MLTKQLKLLTLSLTTTTTLFSNVGFAADARLTGEVEVFKPRTQQESFGYSGAGARAPQNWGNLTAFEGNECGTGQAQSPIDLAAGSGGDDEDDNELSITTNYSDGRLAVENLGTTIEFPMSSSSNNTAVINGESYRLAQFHFHTPSEHTVNGAEYPLEIHMVHVREGAGGTLSFGDLAVLGVMVTEGEPTRAFSGNNGAGKLDQLIPRNENLEFIFDQIEINPAELLPGESDDERGFYRYNGSLTTPPCSELVIWSVFSEPITMSKGQIRVFRNALGDLRFAGIDGENDRPTQPLNGRDIIRANMSDD